MVYKEIARKWKIKLRIYIKIKSVWLPRNGDKIKRKKNKEKDKIGFKKYFLNVDGLILPSKRWFGH